jgi:prephenate dehydratase
VPTRETGTRNDQFREVCSQEPAIKQCLASIKAEKFQVTYTNDTAAAAELVRKSKRRDLAAITSESAGRLHGLENLGTFNDNINNFTRFLYFVHPSQISQALRLVREKCRTTFFLSGDLYPESGRSPFSVYSENRVKIGRNEGILPDFDAHEVIIDARGHNKSANVDACLKELSRMGLSVRILGCYRPEQPGRG